MIYEVRLRIKVEADCYEAATVAGHRCIKELAGRADYALEVISEGGFRYLLTPADANAKLTDEAASARKKANDG